MRRLRESLFENAFPVRFGPSIDFGPQWFKMNPQNLLTPKGYPVAAIRVAPGWKGGQGELSPLPFIHNVAAGYSSLISSFVALEAASLALGGGDSRTPTSP
jgi:hypothetical protein